MPETVEVLGSRWGGRGDRALRERIGVQLQDSELTESLTVYETVRLFRSMYRQGRDVDAVIAAVELEEKRNARLGKLSGGQKQRTALACALVGTPDLLFLGRAHDRARSPGEDQAVGPGGELSGRRRLRC